MKKSIIFMMLATLLLASCTQKEGSKSEESKETTSQQQSEVVTKNINNNETKDIKKENSSEDMMDNNSTMMDNQNMVNNSMMNETRIINIDAKRWEYSKKLIRVKKGEKVIIKINNVDFEHGIAIPGMKLVGNKEVTLDTSKTGTFDFRCPNYCGSGHANMTGKIIVE